MNIAIIPARGGSQRIRLKNIKIFKKKPILQWTIEILRKSKLIDLIVLTSDHIKILDLGKKYGCDFLIKRDKRLSKDKVPTISVIKDTINKLKKNYEKIERANIACIYPCNPLISINDLKKGFNKLKKNNSKFIMAVSEYNHPYGKTFFMNKNNKIIRSNKNVFTASKNFIKTYYENGQFCIAKTQSWTNSKNVFQNSLGVKIPSWRTSDIDNIISETNLYKSISKQSYDYSISFFSTFNIAYKLWRSNIKRRYAKRFISTIRMRLSNAMPIC